jgi:hypothetical protein
MYWLSKHEAISPATTPIEKREIGTALLNPTKPEEPWAISGEKVAMVVQENV